MICVLKLNCKALTMFSLRSLIGQDATQRGVGPNTILLCHRCEQAERHAPTFLQKAVCHLKFENVVGQTPKAVMTSKSHSFLHKHMLKPVLYKVPQTAHHHLWDTDLHGGLELLP